jgi:hypothetical protein
MESPNDLPKSSSDPIDRNEQLAVVRRRQPLFRYFLFILFGFVAFSLYVIYDITHPYGPATTTELVYVDAVDGKPVPSECREIKDGTPGSLDEGPGIVDDQRPLGLTTYSILDHNIWVELQISAAGYETQTLRLDENSAAREIVRMVPTTQGALPSATQQSR